MKKTLVGSIVAGALALFSTGVLADDTKTLKIASSYPAVSTLTDQATFIADRVKTLTEGKVIMEFKPAGALVPAFQVLDATASGAADGAWTQSYYWVGKDKTLSLFNSPLGGPYGMDGMDFLGWMFHGGGLDLYRTFYKDVLKLDVVPFPVMPAQNQPLGWFHRPIKDLADLKNFKCRQTGINVELYARMGMQTIGMPGGEIAAAGRKGVINCAEFVGGLEDQRMGFSKIWKYYYLNSLHEHSNTGDLLINGKVWRSLSKQQQTAIRSAAYESYLWWMTDMQGKNGQALAEMIEQDGVKVMKTPADIIEAELKTIDAMLAEESAKNPWFAKVLASQKAWAKKVVPFKNVAFTPYNYAADYYWGN
jgi:TRAP-type mannitol/chloroaromatic compound transport system substrate-binding protein